MPSELLSLAKFASHVVALNTCCPFTCNTVRTGSSNTDRRNRWCEKTSLAENWSRQVWRAHYAGREPLWTGGKRSGEIPDDEFVHVAPDHWRFETTKTRRRFIPFGANLVLTSKEDLNNFGRRYGSERYDRILADCEKLRVNLLKVFLPVGSLLPDPQHPGEARIASGYLDNLEDFLRLCPKTPYQGHRLPVGSGASPDAGGGRTAANTSEDALADRPGSRFLGEFSRTSGPSSQRDWRESGGLLVHPVPNGRCPAAI